MTFSPRVRDPNVRSQERMFSKTKSSLDHQALPTLESLPKNRWVVVPKSYNDMETNSQINNWFSTHKIKKKTIYAVHGGHKVLVFLFKRTRAAVFFKITWG